MEAAYSDPRVRFYDAGTKEKRNARIQIDAAGRSVVGGFPGLHDGVIRHSDYAKKEKKGCNFCHSKVAPTDKELMKKSLTDAGKYYQSHDHSLTGFAAEKK